MIFQPKLNLDINNIGEAGWNMGLGAGVIVAAQRYHAYYYDVPSAYATLVAPHMLHAAVIRARSLSPLSAKIHPLLAGWIRQVDTLNGSVLTDSPLVKAQQNFTVGIALSWIFSQSKTLVKERQ